MRAQPAGIVNPCIKTVIRGEFAFTISVAAAPGSAADSEHIAVSRDGRCIDAGRLEVFSTAYMASSRYKLAFFRADPKPVARIGKTLVGPDALAAISAALKAARAELPSRTGPGAGSVQAPPAWP